MAVASPVGIMLIDSPFRYRRGIGSPFTNRVSSGAGKVHTVSRKSAFARATKAKYPTSRKFFSTQRFLPRANAKHEPEPIQNFVVSVTFSVRHLVLAVASNRPVASTEDYGGQA
jgi:hypothetical protein